ncbi:MAG TPA: radical SAM protein [Myxococcota bacterium]|nr:radical SAM protein [Myxococcota bacterium]
MRAHPIGELSPSGVLDVGLRCVHSCNFCYYSYWDGTGDQFAGMRKAPWRSRQELVALLDDFKKWGLTRFDVTGGEPTLHPELVPVMAYAHQGLGLRARITTLGQFLDRPLRGGKRPLLEELHEAGVRELLFSLHAVDTALFHAITKADLSKLLGAMAHADDLGMTSMTNTVVHKHNVEHLPAIARHVAGTSVHLANFIVMKVEWGWAHDREGAVERKARYADLLPSLREAVAILEAAGKGVNVRYGPYCAYPGLEKNLVGFKGVQLDPFEWRNGTRGGAGDGPYGKPPFLFFDSLDGYLARHPKDVETKPGYNMTFGPKCADCALRPICDGVDRDYAREHGFDELAPYVGEPVTDLVHFRRANPRAFLLPG